MDGTELSFMRKAIAIASKSPSQDGPADTRPRPKVGAVVVQDGSILGTAFRGETGAGDHAEFAALERKLKHEPLSGSTVYTTLEPCTQARTHPKQPCCEWLIERRVERVVIGMLDPNQDICGRGMRRLREAGVATEMFPHTLMAEVEEQNRAFTRAHREISAQRSALKEAIDAAGITRLVPSREYYARFRPEAPTIDKYISTAQRTLVIVSINLMTGVVFDDVCAALKGLLSPPRPLDSITISLLNPTDVGLMTAASPMLDSSPDELAEKIRITIRKLDAVRRALPTPMQGRLAIRVHNALPMGSAILIDHAEEHGRIQIETKPYRAGFTRSFAVEVGRPSPSGLYDTLSTSYNTLLEDGHGWDAVIGVPIIATKGVI